MNIETRAAVIAELQSIVATTRAKADRMCDDAFGANEPTTGTRWTLICGIFYGANIADRRLRELMEEQCAAVNVAEAPPRTSQGEGGGA